ncbi:hypothetical protein MTR_3g086410 [Medicago truncatula]|uniref:Uncharacterized protein n=1 Tax=Medicago truncatula TaxID=3880 RepID=G7J339_MEDTR|nr:hypothetical protein MTR_3g086410 [Medicago truncatula]
MGLNDGILDFEGPYVTVLSWNKENRVTESHSDENILLDLKTKDVRMNLTL